MSNRSWLYVPGDARDKLDGALGRGADAVIVDLEDSIAAASKELARATAIDWLASVTAQPDTPASEVWVRINAADAWRDDDLAALAELPPGGVLAGVVVPKVTSDLVAEVCEALASADDGPAPSVAGLIEDARGLVDVAAIAATPGLSHLGMGEADLRAELGLDPSDDEPELRPLRLSVVVASAAAGIEPPVGATSTNFRDLVALGRSTERLRRLGFAGRTAIHPRQVPVINEAFTPTVDQVATAREVLGRLAAAAADGQGVATDADGRMVDEAVARQARHVLALAEATERHDDPVTD